LAQLFSSSAFAALPPMTNAAIKFPADLVPAIPWYVRLTSTEPVSACVQ
jgi:hypothetical protein